MIAPVKRYGWKQSHVGWRIDENTSGSGKMGQGYAELLLCKSLKCCATEGFFERALWSCKEEKDMPTIRNKETI